MWTIGVISTAILSYCLYTYVPIKVNYLYNNSNVEKINHNYYTNIQFRGKEYKAKVNISRKPQTNTIDKVIDKYETDVTDDVLQFLGPNYSFINNTILTPHDLGFSKLTFYIHNMFGDEYTLDIKEDEPIILTSTEQNI